MPFPLPPHRRHLPALLASVLAVTAVLWAPSPAAATPAPLVTEDAIGLRVDETAFAPSLPVIEAELQPLIDGLIDEGASDPKGPFGDHIALLVSSEVELSLDFLDPGGPIPHGGITLEVEVHDLQIRYTMDPIWPFSDCHIYLQPATGSASAPWAIDPDPPSGPPFTPRPAVADWDQAPGVSTTGVCWVYVVHQALTVWWQDLWDHEEPDSVAGRIQAEVDAVAQDLLADLWEGIVAPTIDSFEAMAILIDQVRTDDHGFLTTLTTDATAGVTLPGVVGGPFNVSGAEDSGSTTDLDDVLAHRDPLIVSTHPNVLNQIVWALKAAGLDDSVLPAFLPAAPPGFIPCSTCGPYPGDDRHTEIFEVG